MAILTPSFLFDLESNMRIITAQDYQRLASRVWWPQIAKQSTSGSKAERVSWLLDTALIRPTGHGGNIQFDDIVSQTTEVEHVNAAGALKVKKEEFDDLDGKGVDGASHWSRQMGAYAAYWPQKIIAQQILANPVGYDGKRFFALDHPVNPYLPRAGTYANLFTGVAGTGTGAGGNGLPTIYPGALPIDDSVSVEQAVRNLAKAIAYIASIRMPSGADPRFLRLDKIFVPPALVARAQQITKAKFIAQAAASAAGAGSADVEAMILNYGLGTPVEVHEVQAAFGGSDTDYYLACEEIMSSELGAFNYIQREPFSVLYYGPMTDAQLARVRVYEWTTEGRYSVMPGHPFLFYKVRSS